MVNLQVTCTVSSEKEKQCCSLKFSVSLYFSATLREKKMISYLVVFSNILLSSNRFAESQNFFFFEGKLKARTHPIPDWLPISEG